MVSQKSLSKDFVIFTASHFVVRVAQIQKFRNRKYFFYIAVSNLVQGYNKMTDVKTKFVSLT